TRVHGLQHVQGFFATDLTDDDSIGPHTKRVDDQVADTDCAVSFYVRRPGFHTGYVRLAQAQFSCAFNGHDALVFRNVGREHAEECSFTGARSASHEDVQSRPHEGLQHLTHASGRART